MYIKLLVSNYNNSLSRTNKIGNGNCSMKIGGFPTPTQPSRIWWWFFLAGLPSAFARWHTAKRLEAKRLACQQRRARRFFFDSQAFVLLPLIGEEHLLKNNLQFLCTVYLPSVYPCIFLPKLACFIRVSQFLYHCVAGLNCLPTTGTIVSAAAGEVTWSCISVKKHSLR